MDALPRVGESDPARHIMVVREDTAKLKGWGALDTVLISKKPFTDDDIARARQIIAEGHWEEIYLPGDAPKNPFGQLLTAADPAAFLHDYPFDLSPVTDDRPFFFYTVQPRDLWDYIATANHGSADFKVNRAVPLLFGLMAVSLCATALILLLPRFLLGTRLPKQKGVIAFLWYFICLGAGYILIQVALIQKFVLLLGHPTYALVVIVFSMLVASGIGSYFSRRVIADNDGRLMRVLFAISILVAILAFGARPLSQTAARMAHSSANVGYRPRHRSRRVPNGDAVSKWTPQAGAAASSIRPLGLVFECRSQCTRIRRSHLPGNLHRPSRDTSRGWRTLPMRAGSDRLDESYSPACLSCRVASSICVHIARSAWATRRAC